MEKWNQTDNSFKCIKSAEGNWLIRQWRNETTLTKKSKSNCQPVIFSFLWQLTDSSTQEWNQTRKKNSNCQTVIYLFFFYSKIAFSQLVMWGKMSVSKTLRKYLEQKRALHFHRRKANMANSLRAGGQKPFTTTGEGNECLQPLSTKGGTVSLLQGAALIAATGRLVCAPPIRRVSNGPQLAIPLCELTCVL